MSGTRPDIPDSFIVKGVGCWCPGEMTLNQLRLSGHTKQCTAARKGWESNNRDLREMELQRRLDQEVGRQIRESAAAVLSDKEEK